MRVARNIIIAAVLASLSAVAVTAQDPQPLPTEPPDQLRGAKLGAYVNGFDDPAVNRIIDRAVKEAIEVIEGNRKRARYVVTTPERSVSQSARDAADDDFAAVVVHGGFGPETILYATQFDGTQFLDIGQATPCVTADGVPDPSFTCAGGTDALPFNYMAVSFAEDEAGYLAGVVAAGASRNDRLGIIGGSSSCASCNRYMQGFELGARSLKPDIRIDKTFIADGADRIGFTDAETAEAVTRAFIDVYQPDVLFPVARANTLPMLAVACDLGVRIVGSDLDISAEHPELAECVLTSATKPIGEAVTESIFDFTSGRLERVKEYDLSNDGVAITDEWQRVPGIPPDLFAEVDAATSEVRLGSATTCPEYCGRPEPAATTPPDGEAEAVEGEPGAAASDDAGAGPEGG